MPKVGDIEDAAAGLSAAELEEGRKADSGVALDLDALGISIFKRPNRPEISGVQGQIAALLDRKAGMKSKRKYIYDGLGYGLIAVNGYPVFNDQDRFVLLYSYLLLICTTALYIKVYDYSQSIKGGCEFLGDHYTTYHEALKRAFENRLIKRVFKDRKPDFEMEEEIDTIVYVVSKTWSDLVNKYQINLNQINDFRVVEITINIFCAMMQILCTFKEKHPDKTFVLGEDFLNALAFGFFAKMDGQIFKTPLNIFKLKNPFTHYSFSGKSPKIEDFILVGIQVFRDNQSMVKIVNLETNEYEDISLDDLGFVEVLRNNASSKRQAEHLLGTPILTETKLHNPELRAILAQGSNCVLRKDGTDNWIRANILKTLRNAALHLPIALTIYNTPYADFADKWLWILSGAASYFFDFLRDRNVQREGAIKASHKAMLTTLSDMGKAGRIVFQSSGAALDTDYLEVVKITTALVFCELGNRGKGFFKLPSGHMGYLYSTVFACTATELSKVELPDARRVAFLSKQIADYIEGGITTNRFTTVLKCGTRLESDLSINTGGLRSAINTVLMYGNQEEDVQDVRRQHANVEKRRRRRKKQHEEVNPDIDVDVSYHSANDTSLGGR